MATEKEMLVDIVGSIGDIKSQVKKVEKDSARYDELQVQFDKALNDLDAVKDRQDAIETANKRIDNEVDEVEVAREEYKAAFNDYLVNHNEVGLAKAEFKLLSVGSDPDGGYVASDEMSNRVIETIYETSPMRQVAYVQNTAKKEVTFLIDKDEAGAQWTAEQGVNSNDTTPQFGELVIPVHKMSTEPAITTEMLQDADINIEAWLQAKVADKFGRVENDAFVNGNGVGKPRGFTTYDSGTAWGEIEQHITAATGVLDEIDILSLMDLVKDGYLGSSSFAMSRRTNTVIRKIQDNDGNFLFTGQDLAEGTLFGYKINRFEDMAKPTVSGGSTYATGDLPIAFGDFSTAYTVVDRQGISVIRDPFTSKGFVKFYTTRRVGGDITNFEAIKLLSIKA